jgi:predicted deacylase
LSAGIVRIEDFDLERFEPGAVSRASLHLVDDALGNAVAVPMLVARGRDPGPVFGVTAAVHGNEINGIPVIQQLFREVDADELRGTLVGVPVVTVHAFVGAQRTFGEGFDLNRIMPGRPDGNVGEVYAHRFLTRFVEHLDYLVDLHTASFGRINSLYVRADLRHEASRRMAMLQSPDIIVHNEARDGTLRDAAMDRGIAAITVEVGDPLRFQKRLIRGSLHGLRSVLRDMGMLDDTEEGLTHEPVICGRSYWIYAQHGGLLDVLPGPADEVEADAVIARVRNIYGDTIATYRAPERAVIVGRSTNPICTSGSRVAHLGIPCALDDIIGT